MALTTEFFFSTKMIAMRKLVTPVCLILLVGIIACNTAENKVPQMADDFCGCFRTLEDSLSAEAKQLLTKASTASDPDTAMSNAMLGMSDEKKVSLGMEMMSFQSVQDPNSPISKCMKEIEKKYKSERTTDKKKFGAKLIRELESKKGCEVTTAIMKLGFKQEFK